MIFEKIKKNELFRGSLILFILINLGNLINYLYQIVMARMLGPSDYGILAVLVSLTYIFAVPTIAIQTAVSKKIAILNVKKEYSKMNGLFFSFLKKLFIFSLIVFILFAILSFFYYKAPQYFFLAFNSNRHFNSCFIYLSSCCRIFAGNEKILNPWLEHPFSFFYKNYHRDNSCNFWI